MLRRTSLIATFALAFTTATHAGAGYVRPLVPETIEPPAGLKLVLCIDADRSRLVVRRSAGHVVR